MKVLAWVIAAVFACGVLVAACTALVNDEDSYAPLRLQLVSHDECWGDECDGQYSSGGDYGHNRRDDRNRNRGAFSPGPFDRSPVDFSNSCISLDCSGRDEGRRRQPPDQQPESLFPVPTPGGVQKFVLSTIEAGIGLGRLFANATIDFVSSIMVGIA